MADKRGILVPRGRAPFGQHQEITTSGLVQRHSVFEWLCEHNRLKPEPIRFVRLDSEHAQSDGKSVNRGLPVLDQARGRDFLVLTKRSTASGDENDKRGREWGDSSSETETESDSDPPRSSRRWRSS